MRWMLAVMVAALAGCVEDAPAGRAYDGFRWACAHAPPCPTSVDCAAPCWSVLTAPMLDEVAACLLGPCEARAPCVSEAVTVCPIDGGVTHPAVGIFTGRASSPDDGD